MGSGCVVVRISTGRYGYVLRTNTAPGCRDSAKDVMCTLGMHLPNQDCGYEQITPRSGFEPISMRN